MLFAVAELLVSISATRLYFNLQSSFTFLESLLQLRAVRLPVPKTLITTVTCYSIVRAFVRFTWKAHSAHLQSDRHGSTL